MEDNSLIKKIRKQYINAGLSVFPSLNIIRGTKHTISSIAEDIFALYVSEILGDKFEVWIDPQIIIDNRLGP